MKEQTEIYEKITANIIEAIELGCSKFECHGIRSESCLRTPAITADTGE